ncbi:MAG: hypothetical protein DME76_03310 [Verrucomicrobia bacterium]|nr:MAG: hypothetical protein DME76_03310 [Verrucomicrobiota bacterium]
MAELTLDKVTDLFGKPTAVTDPTPETGPILVYANQGLVFRFKRSILADSQTQRLASIIVYLTAQEDSETHVSCSGYRGTFAQGITSDWKAPMVMQSFGQYTPTDSYDPLFAERARLGETVDTALNKMSVPGGAPIRAKSLISTITFVTVKFPGSQAMFQYEENTKFLQYVEIIPR